MEHDAALPPVTAAEMRALEAQAVAAGQTWRGLMERAGAGIAAVALGLLHDERRPVLVLVGPGNNGGDGLVVADRLAAAGLPVTVYLWQRALEADDWSWQAVVRRGIATRRAADDPSLAQLGQLLGQAALIIDGLLGSGVNRPVPADLQAIIALVNMSRHGEVLAIDLPSGINADTGKIEGAAIRADVTAATGRLKWGHVRGGGPAAAGRLEVVPIGIDEQGDVKL